MFTKAFKRIYNGEMGDRSIWFIIFILGLISMVAVYSSTMDWHTKIIQVRIFIYCSIFSFWYLVLGLPIYFQ